MLKSKTCKRCQAGFVPKYNEEICQSCIIGTEIFEPKIETIEKEGKKCQSKNTLIQN